MIQYNPIIKDPHLVVSSLLFFFYYFVFIVHYVNILGKFLAEVDEHNQVFFIDQENSSLTDVLQTLWHKKMEHFLNLHVILA